MGDNAVKKIIKIIVPLILMLVCVTGAFAQGTLSEEILNQAKREAGLFLELKSALGLDWLDEYNAYLENPTDNPEPSWDLSVADLVSGGYLSDSFPSDFMITKSGQEVKISRIITSQAMKDVLPIYLPSVTIAGDVVSLIVQRPEQWVAWEAGLLGKVSRDGSDNPDILPNAVLDFGKGSEIRFINDDGKLTGIESLIYKTQELDDRFVNTSGDDEMSGTLTAGGLKVGPYAVWHEGNVGAGSGLDADLLDGEHGSYYLAAENLTGIVPAERLDGIYGIDISGNAATATFADRAHFAETIPDHTHGYVLTTGDTMTGKLVLPDLEVQSGGTIQFKSEKESAVISADQSGNLNLQANKVTVPSKMDVGGLKITDIYAQDVFGWKSSVDLSGSNVGIRVPDQNILLGFNDKGGITVINTANGAPLFELDRKGQLYVNRNKVWHAGNDGSGSGLDADLLDGLDSSRFLYTHYLDDLAPLDLNDITTPGFYYCGGHVNAATMKNIPIPYAFHMIVLKGDHCLQIFFPFDISYHRKFYLRFRYAGNWYPWVYVDIDGQQETYVPGNFTAIDLSNNPIDVTHLLNPTVTLLAEDSVSDETGVYSIKKYKYSISNSDIVNNLIKTPYMNQIKNITGLRTVGAINVRFSSIPVLNGIILAAAALYAEGPESYAEDYRYKYLYCDFYNSIVSAKDIVNKDQGLPAFKAAGNVKKIDFYTMKSTYQYGSTYLEAESFYKAEIVRVWGEW